MRALLFAVIGLLLVVRHDFWFWNDDRIVAGLPVGLTYHVGYCVAVSAVMVVLVRRAWPDVDPGGEDR